MLGKIMDMYAHMIWAEKQVWKSIEELDEAVINEKLLSQLSHLHIVQKAFLDAWKNESREDLMYTKFEEIQELKEFSEQYFSDLESFLETLSKDELEKEIFIPWQPLFEKYFKIKAQPITLFDTMYQAVSHSSYHRGQINKTIREVRGTPTTVDYISWAWSGRPKE